MSEAEEKRSATLNQSTKVTLDAVIALVMLSIPLVDMFLTRSEVQAAMSEKVDRMVTDISDIRTGQQRLASRVEGVLSVVAKNSARLDERAGKFQALESQILSMRNELTVMNTTIAEMKGEIAEVKRSK